MKNILILAYTDLSKDPRPLRQIKMLNSHCNVYTCGAKASGLEKEFVTLNKLYFLKDWLRLILLKFNLYEKYYWDKEKLKTYDALKNHSFDLIIAHEIRLVPLALKLIPGAKIILDAHEYSPKNFDDNFLWRFFIKKYYTYLCDNYINKINQLTTVSQGIVEAYQNNFGVKSTLVTNASDFEEHSPQPVGEKIKIIHHGIAGSSRKLELMIDTMQFLDERYELYLMLVYTKSTQIYYQKLVARAKKFKGIFFISPVPKNEIIRFSNQFDIGVIFMPPVNFNLEHTLPNKFFEMIQSRLVIAIGPDKEMSPYIEKYGLGVRATNWTPKALAKAILSLSKEEVNRIKANVHKAANDLSAESENEKFLKIVNETI